MKISKQEFTKACKEYQDFLKKAKAPTPINKKPIQMPKPELPFFNIKDKPDYLKQSIRERRDLIN